MKRLALLLVPLAAYAAAPVTDWSPNFTGTVAWHGNISNGEAVWDRIGALELGADVVASSQYDLSHVDAIHASAHFAADWFPRFYRLTRGAAGARLDWQHTFGNDAFAPVFTVEGSADGIGAVESERQGFDGAITLKLSKKFADAWRVAISERFEQYAAKAGVFDSGSSEAAFEVSRDINDATRFVLSGRWRDGDVVTYAQYHRPDLLAIAHDHLPLRTFHEAMTAYAANGQTVAGRAALVHATTEETALVLAYEYARTTGTNLRFVNQVVSLSFVRQY